MIRHTAIPLFISLLTLLPVKSAYSAVQLYSGHMEILETSGKGCSDLNRTQDVTLVLSDSAGNGGALSGYFVGGEISIGKFSGNDPARLDVRYPYHDEVRSSGHILSIARTKMTLVAELRDRHIDGTEDECNFDRAHLDLSRTVGGDADAQLARLAGQFEAQLTRSRALAEAQSSGYDAALPYFEKALALADTYVAKDGNQITSYIVGLATCYIWLERFDEFNRLFDARIITIQDETVRSVFSRYRVRFLMNAGRDAFKRDEFDQALNNFEHASKLQPGNREAIAAVLSVHMRSGQYSEAFSYLERLELQLKDDLDRNDIRQAEGMVLYKKALKDDKTGNVPEAEKSLEQAMVLDPGSVLYLITLARMRHKAGKLADADTLLQKGLELFSDAQSQDELHAASEKIHLTEMILNKIRRTNN